MLDFVDNRMAECNISCNAVRVHEVYLVTVREVHPHQQSNVVIVVYFLGCRHASGQLQIVRREAQCKTCLGSAHTVFCLPGLRKALADS